MSAQQVVLRMLAATGDPLADWLRGSPRTDVHRVFERLRSQGPVARSRTGLVAVTSRPLCDQLLRDRRLGVRRVDGESGFPRSAGRRSAASALGESFVELDGIEHSRLRRLVAPSFRPAASAGWTPRLERLLDRVVVRAAGRAGRGGPVDLVREIAYPFPIAAIAAILGVPVTDTADFARIGGRVGRALDGVRTRTQARELRAAEGELMRLFARLLDERAVDPRDDVLSVIAGARAEGTLSTRDAVHTAELLLVTGFETTSHLIGNAVAALASEPDRWRELVERPELAAAVVEETLRWDPPVQATGRIAHTELEVSGVCVPRDGVVVLLTAAANRDPTAYADPQRFDPHRSGEPDHLAFSVGAHYCLGATLARLEAELALRTLAERFPGLTLAGRPRRRPGATLRAYATLPVILRP